MIFSMVLSALLVAGTGLMAIGSGFGALAEPTLLICACGSVLPLALLITLLVFLYQGLKSETTWRLQQAQYQASYWQYYQQAQQAPGNMQANAGYGYGQPQQQQPKAPDQHPDAGG